MSVKHLVAAAALLVPMFGAFSATPAASEWQLRSPFPGEAPCRAVKSGRDVNTPLLRNRDNRLILIAANPGWDHKGGPTPVSLSIDGSPPVGIIGAPIGPIFMVLIQDDARTKRIGKARTLRWTLPWGDFTADVTGLGDAFASIGICPGK